ncbi:MAG TPA: hypothetical protein VGE07_23040, partial [Herpetosiphonaceae bacterium]
MSQSSSRTALSQHGQPDAAEFNAEDLAILRHMMRQQPGATKRAQQPVERGLIDRASLERSLPTAKAVLATLGWGNSAITTMTTGAQLELLLWHASHPSMEGPLPWLGAVIGLGVAALLTFGQIYTAGRSAWGYWLCLLPDALMTAFQWYWWLLRPLFTALLPNPALAPGLAAVV